MRNLSHTNWMILGGGGLVGSALHERCRVLGISCTAFSHAELDMGDVSRVAQVIDAYRPSVIVNAAAATNVEGCESEVEKAFAVNAVAPAHWADECLRRGICWVHLSTDYVFDGKKKSPYREEDPRSPLGVYARSKALGEEKVLEANPTALVIRVAWVFGKGGKTFMSKLPRLLKEQERICAVWDRSGNCTYVKDLVDGILALVEVEAKGIVHFTNEGDLSWYDFAVALKEEAERRRMEFACREIVPIKSSSLHFVAPRPDYSVLDKTHYVELTQRSIRCWKEALGDFLRDTNFF